MGFLIFVENFHKKIKLKGYPNKSIPTAACPKYANAACFTAAAWDDEVVNGDKQSFVQDHRGCSAFVFGTTAGTDCQSGQTPNGQFSECKYTCNDENCNTNELIKVEVFTKLLKMA